MTSYSALCLLSAVPTTRASNVHFLFCCGSLISHLRNDSSGSLAACQVVPADSAVFFDTQEEVGFERWAQSDGEFDTPSLLKLGVELTGGLG